MGKKEVIITNVAHALGWYMPRTYTWVYNQLHFFKSTYVLILSSMLHPDRKYFSINQHTLFSFPGLEALNKPGISQRMFRRLLRFILIDSRFDLLVFAWKAKKGGCTLIHAHFANTGWKFIPVAKMLGIPLVVSFYGYDYDFLPNVEPIWKERYRRLFKYGTLFLTEGTFGRKRLIEKGLSTEKVKVHHLGVDVENIPFEIRELDHGKPFKLVQVANLVPKKGHRNLIQALNILKDRNEIRNISLTIIGSGPLKKELLDLTFTYGLNQYVNFIDHIPYEDIHQELLKHHVFVHPSITTADGDCEGGAPVVLLDAQATGMPVIATYHCDIPEEVLNKKTGILVPENNPNALADAITEFIKDPVLLIQFGRNGREHVENNYAASKQSLLLEAIYCELIKSFLPYKSTL